MTKISKNFKLSEFAVSASYPHLVESVPVEYLHNVENLVHKLLQILCDYLGATCVVTSGYRNDALNFAVGGESSSHHRYAAAADCVFKVNGLQLPAITVLEAIRDLKLDFDQAIAYPNFVHLSFLTHTPNRNQFLYSKSYKGKRL